MKTIMTHLPDTLTSKHDPRITYLVREVTTFTVEVIDHKGRAYRGYTVNQAYREAEEHLMGEPMLTTAAIRDWMDYRDDLLGQYAVVA